MIKTQDFYRKTRKQRRRLPEGKLGAVDAVLRQKDKFLMADRWQIGISMKGGFSMAIEVVPHWMANLEEEDIAFIKNFLLASGSLKEIARQYQVTYPTVRLRLDKLIQKIRISEDFSNEPYVALIKRLAVGDKIDFDTAKILISEYKKWRDV